MDGTALDENHRNVASTAATGFGLTGLCIAAERKWIDREKAKERVRSTLRFFATRAFHKNGWFYHWLDAKSGERRWQSEVSSIDTALLVGGVLTAGQCFREDAELSRLAKNIYDRIDFRWMLNGHPLLSRTAGNRNRFLTRWDTYSETRFSLLAIDPSPPNLTASWCALWRVATDMKLMCMPTTAYRFLCTSTARRVGFQRRPVKGDGRLL